MVPAMVDISAWDLLRTGAYSCALLMEMVAVTKPGNHPFPTWKKANGPILPFPSVPRAALPFTQMVLPFLITAGSARKAMKICQVCNQRPISYKIRNLGSSVLILLILLTTRHQMYSRPEMTVLTVLLMGQLLILVSGVVSPLKMYLLQKKFCNWSMKDREQHSQHQRELNPILAGMMSSQEMTPTITLKVMQVTTPFLVVTAKIISKVVTATTS